MNSLYRKQIIMQIKYSINRAKALADLNHQGLKGRFIEILIRDLFQPLLPSDIGMGNGVILSSNEQQSREQDIVIYDKKILPPLLVEVNSGFFPIESVLFTIEIKSKINKSELVKSQKSAIELLNLDLSAAAYNGNKPNLNIGVKGAISTIFGLSSNLKGDNKEEFKRFFEIQKNFTTKRNNFSPVIKCMCIVGKGCWVNNKELGWVCIDSDGKYSEVIAFLSVIMNTYKEISLSKGIPRLGNYLIDFDTECRKEKEN